tara:strand:+ start:752 stop:853 length:102 start_codon:yes stop_codon:yes gene_type:complete
MVLRVLVGVTVALMVVLVLLEHYLHLVVKVARA